MMMCFQEKQRRKQIQKIEEAKNAHIQRVMQKNQKDITFLHGIVDTIEMIPYLFDLGINSSAHAAFVYLRILGALSLLL